MKNKEENQNFNETELMQQIILLEAIAKKNMSKEAIARYGNLKLAHPETAIKAIAMIAQASQLGQIQKPVSDEEFKALLLDIQQGKKSFNIKISKQK